MLSSVLQSIPQHLEIDKVYSNTSSYLTKNSPFPLKVISPNHKSLEKKSLPLQAQFVSTLSFSIVGSGLLWVLANGNKKDKKLSD